MNKQLRLIFFLTFFVFLFIASISIFLYNDYRSKLDKNLNLPHIELLQINLDVANQAFEEFDTIAKQLSYHPTAHYYVTASIHERKDSAYLLLSYLKSVSYGDDVHSIYIVDLYNKRILSSLSDYDQDWVWTEASDQTWIPWVEEMNNTPMLITRRKMGLGVNMNNKELISLFRPIKVNDKLVGTVIINVDYDKFFANIYSQVNTPQYIFDFEGELIYPDLNLPIQASEVRKAMNVMGDRPFQEVELDKRTYLANQAYSGVTGWHWISFIPLEDLLKNAYLVRNIIVSLCILSILIGYLAIHYYSYIAFRPLKRVKHLITNSKEASSAADLQDVEKYILNLIKKFNLNNEVVKHSLPELRSKFIRDILLQQIGIKEIQTKYEKYFSDWTNEHLFTAVISINCYAEWASSFNEEDQLLLKYALFNLVEEMLDTKWRVVSIGIDKENTLLIIQSNNRHENQEFSLQSNFRGIIENSKKYLQLSLSVGIGNQIVSIKELTQSYVEARDALKSRLYTGYGQVNVFSQEALENKEAQENDKFNRWFEQWMREIIAVIEFGDKNSSVEAVEQWSNWILENRPCPESIYASANKFIITLFNLFQSNSLSEPWMLENYTEHQLRMMDIQDIKKLMTEAVIELADGLKQKAGRKEYHLVKRMIDYMEHNLSENVGLEQVADSVQMSTSFVSKLFKQETDFSVYEYLTNLRIEKACKLLIETDNKLTEIALQVGYQNENSFIRTFRKLKVVTPGKYREMKKVN